MGKIQDKRVEKGFTQVEIGKICSVSDRTVINWEAKDEVLYLKDAVKVSRLLDIPLHNLCKSVRTPKVRKLRDSLQQKDVLIEEIGKELTQEVLNPEPEQAVH